MKLDTRRCLCLIIIVYVALASVYSFVDPLKYGPDEPAHFIYIRSMAVDFTPPPVSHENIPDEFSTMSHEGHQPPLYFAIMAIPYAILNFFGVSSDTIWRILRLLTIPFGAVWIFFVWRLAREFFTNDRYALAAAGFTALIPVCSFMSGVLNNDVLVALFFTWSLIYILAYFKSGAMTAKTSVLLGILVGLAILSKAQGLILIFVFLVTCLMVVRRAHYSNYRDVLRSAGITIGIAIIVSGWWFVRNWAVHGALMPQSLYAPVMSDPLASIMATPGAVGLVVWFVAARAWGYFVTPYWLLSTLVGWNAYLSLLIGTAAVLLIGFIIQLRRNGSIDRKSLALLIFTALVQSALYLYHVLVVDFGAKDQGRLFLTVAGVVGICAVIAIDGFLPSIRAKKIGAIVTVVLMLLLNVATIIGAFHTY